MMDPVNYQAIIEDVLKDWDRLARSDQLAHLPAQHPENVDDPSPSPAASSCEAKAEALPESVTTCRPHRGSSTKTVSLNSNQACKVGSPPNNTIDFSLLEHKETPRCMNAAGDSNKSEKVPDISHVCVSDPITGESADTSTVPPAKHQARNVHKRVTFPDDLAVRPLHHPESDALTSKPALSGSAAKPITRPESRTVSKPPITWTFTRPSSFRSDHVHHDQGKRCPSLYKAMCHHRQGQQLCCMTSSDSHMSYKEDTNSLNVSLSDHTIQKKCRIQIYQAFSNLDLIKGDFQTRMQYHTNI